MLIASAGAAIATGVLFGIVPALLTVPLVVLVSAARLKLQRHTPAQILGGTMVGALVPMIWPMSSSPPPHAVSTPSEPNASTAAIFLI